MPSALICDDEKGIADELAEFFDAKGVDVACAYCGGEARELIAAQRFDYLVTDGAMPGGSGEELVAFVLALPEDQRPRVICLMTGAADTQAELDPTVLKVRKPFDPELLHDSLLCLLNEKCRESR